jgi:hypothetical protein
MRYPSLWRAVAITAPVLLVALAATGQAANAQAQRPSDAQAAQAPLTAAQARALSTNVTHKVIVVLRNQVTSLPDNASNASRRTADVHAAQRGVMSDLTATRARNIKSLSLVDAVAATVSPGEAKRLAANPAVARVVPDLPIPLASKPQTAKPAAGTKPLPGACTSGKTVQLNPEAIENIHAATQSGQGAAAQSLGYTGAGVKVGWIADGVDIDNPDFIRANGQHVFSDYQDFSGTGTSAPTDGGEAFLDSSSIAAQGRETYNVASYGVGLSTACNIRIRGVAPGASEVGLNVFGSAEFAFNSVFLEAINYAVTHDHVNVLNESFGSNPFPDSSSLDLTKMANDAAVKAGVTVTVSSGDAGPTNTIGSPATDPLVISAGASTTYRAYAQTGIGDITAPGVTGWIDNNISGLSSGGFAQDGATVDVVAPGDLNWALCTPDPAKYAACTDFSGNPASVELSGGTSEAAPLTAGVAALVIQAYAKSHHGQHPSPAVVKQIIVSTAQNISAPAEQQGAGLIDAYAAVQAAASYRGSATQTGHAVLKSATQFNATGQPGTPEHFAETLTNDGASSVTLGLSSRTLAPYQPVSTKTLSLTAANGFGAAVTFTVPPGQARLNASVALQGVVDLSLISPSGKLAEFNLPQGVGNYGNAQVADPAAGTWTALVSAGGSGAAIPAKFQASTATWQQFGSLSASSVTLAKGASKTVALTVATPAQSGDQSGAIVVRSSVASPAFAAVTTVPVTLRSLVPAPDPSTTFTGTLTGGNGRSSTTGQTAYYQMDVPAGLKALNVQVSTGNSGNTFLAELVDPATGTAASTATNGLEATTAGGTTALEPEKGAQLHVLNPAAGRWTLIVDFFDTVSGTAVAQPFTVTVNDTAEAASVSGLPDSASTQLPAGQPVTAEVQVTNHGTSPEAYFVDPRLSTGITQKLATQTTSKFTLPDLAGAIPTYLVPSHTTALAARASSSAPIFFDYTWSFGDPDLISTTGKTATGSYAAPQVAAGDWTLTPFLVGPTGANQAKSRTVSTSLTATRAQFDRTVTAPTGDLWLASENPNAAFTPYVVEPGQTVTIPVTITPKGTAGSTVTGTLYLADSSIIPSAVTFNELPGSAPEASDVAAFPYTYVIK